MRKLYISAFFLLLTLSINAQIGGTRTYMFLDLPNSARNTALGGENPAISDENSAIYNPATIDSLLINRLSLNFVNYFAGIKWGSSSFVFNSKKIGNFVVGVQYLNYGKFTAADQSGNITGNFYAADYTLNLGWQYRFDSCFTAGIILKPVFSNYEKYTSLGFATDFALNYTRKHGNFKSSLIFRNLGYQIKPYTPKNHEKLPFDIRLGIYQRLPHSPFAFSIVLHHLNIPDLSYSQTASSSAIYLEQHQQSKIEKFADLSMRHLIAGLEIIPSKHFYISVGYNYQRRQELKLPSKSEIAGFSAGVGIRIKKFSLNYGISRYHIAGVMHIFTFSFDLNNIYKKHIK